MERYFVPCSRSPQVQVAATQISASSALVPQPHVRNFLLLQTIYCPDSSSRSHLQLPQPLGVDFRASCFCHRVGFAMWHPVHAHLPFTEQC